MSKACDTALQAVAARGPEIKRVLQKGLPKRRERLRPTHQEADKGARPGPLGMVKLVLASISVEADGCYFCVLKCGPHWGRTATTEVTQKPAWNWEARLSERILAGLNGNRKRQNSVCDGVNQCLP